MDRHPPDTQPLSPKDNASGPVSQHATGFSPESAPEPMQNMPRVTATENGIGQYFQLDEKTPVEPNDGAQALPDILSWDRSPRHRPRESIGSLVLWGSGVIMLLLLALAQGAWFHRDILVTRYPELQTTLTQLCKQLHCRITRHYDMAAIHVMARNVLVDPRQGNRLLFSATLKNTLPIRQSWPVLQLVLSDYTGKITGEGKFTPHQYLDADLSRMDMGMPPEQPVSFTLTLQSDRDTEAFDGFELHFLPWIPL